MALIAPVISNNSWHEVSKKLPTAAGRIVKLPTDEIHLSNLNTLGISWQDSTYKTNAAAFAVLPKKWQIIERISNIITLLDENKLPCIRLYYYPNNVGIDIKFLTNTQKKAFIDQEMLRAELIENRSTRLSEKYPFAVCCIRFETQANSLYDNVRSIRAFHGFFQTIDLASKAQALLETEDRFIKVFILDKDKDSITVKKLNKHNYKFADGLNDPLWWEKRDWKIEKLDVSPIYKFNLEDELLKLKKD